MSFHATASLLIALSSLALSAFVCLRGKNRTASLMFSLYTLSVAAWSFGQFMAAIAPDSGNALFWTRFYLADAIFIPVLFVHFIRSFLSKKNYPGIFVLYFLGLVLSASSFTPFFIPGVSSKVGFRYYPDPGPGLYIYTFIFAALVSYSLYLLFKTFRKASGTVKNQITYVIVASIIGFSGGSMMFLPIFGINIFPVGYYFVPLYIVIAVYAFMKHRLLEISIVVRRGLVYSILTLLITAIYILTIVLLKDVFQLFVRRTSLVVMPALVLGLVIFLNPLKEKVQAYVDIIFFKDRYTHRKALRNLSFAVRDTSDIEKLVNIVNDNIRSILKISDLSLYILDEKIGKYVLQKGRTAESLEAKEHIVGMLCNSRSVILNGDLPVEIKAMGVAVCFPMIIRGELVGILMLGEKLSGDMYSDEDIDLLSTLSNQMAVSIENAILKEEAVEAERQFCQADKLATVGALAAGLAHEIRNPISAIKGFTQVIDRAVMENDQDTLKDFKEVVPRQLDRIDEIVEKLLTLSKPQRFERIDVAVNKVLDDIVRLIEKQALKQRTRIIRTFADIPQTLADPQQLTQAFLNLILNAMQAMPDGGALEIRTEFIGTESIHIEFIDNGVGIPKDKLPYIFDPFFTTKSGGSGLGLSVTLKIILDHQGKLDVESEAGKGTKFTIMIPVM
jgi:signal transduction histidine kinase